MFWTEKLEFFCFETYVPTIKKAYLIKNAKPETFSVESLDGKKSALFDKKSCLIFFLEQAMTISSNKNVVWKSVIFNYSWCSVAESSTISYTVTHPLKHNKILCEAKIRLNAGVLQPDPWRAIKDTLEESAL